MKSYNQSGEWVSLLPLREAILSQATISGLTHCFYRYPARFSPIFAREAIRAFSKPGDLIFDPFMGGGTTLVEASVLGRPSMGIDNNSLAHFLTMVKTRPLRKRDFQNITDWGRNFILKANLHKKISSDKFWISKGYQRNLFTNDTWPIRKLIEIFLSKLNILSNSHQERFVRCAILKTSQWALDNNKHIPKANDFREKLFQNLEEMILGAKEYTEAIRSLPKSLIQDRAILPRCLNRSIIGVESDSRIKKGLKPKLILTSPPYPGVHVLYHRWQVKGRTETPAPFWIANSMDGKPGSFYTFGDRRQKFLDNYFDTALKAFSSIGRLSTKDTLMVQIVAFSNATWQLPKYLEVLETAGFYEIKEPSLSNASDGRVWRDVPNRKWYADKVGKTSSAREVVLFHKKK